MVFDYKKEFKDLYTPRKKAAIVQVQKMQYMAVRGQGNSNDS